MPAGLTHVINLDGKNVPKVPQGYLHYALGPMRPGIAEGKGTLSGGGQLAMPIGDLMQWDTVVLHRNSVLKPTSWQLLEAEVALPDGHSTGYGMGLELSAHKGERIVGHSGEIAEFVTLNYLMPDLDAGFALITNSDTGPGRVAFVLSDVLSEPDKAGPVKSSPAAETLVRTAMAELQKGTVDQGILSPNLAFYLKSQVLADYQASGASFGNVTNLKQTYYVERGGMQGIGYVITGSSGEKLRVSVYVTADDKLDQLRLSKVEPEKK